MTDQRGVLRILKLAAAQRQLDAAIRMTFADEDVLAATTVAAAAYRLLRDIKRKRGHRVLSDEWRDAIVGTARALVRGEIPDGEVKSIRESDFWPVISELAKRIEAEGAENRCPCSNPLLKSIFRQKLKENIGRRLNEFLIFSNMRTKIMSSHSATRRSILIA